MVTVLFSQDILKFKRIDWRQWLAVGFIVLQIGLIIQARFIPERFFCWAPHDAQVQYELDVTVTGKKLTPEEI
jgi:hypothetical protein